MAKKRHNIPSYKDLRKKLELMHKKIAEIDYYIKQLQFNANYDG